MGGIEATNFRKLLPESLGGEHYYNYWNLAFDRLINKRLDDLRDRPFSELIAKVRPRRIMEIGVRFAWGAERMVKATRRDPSEIEYYGFDLFYKCKANKFICPTEAEIYEKLKRLGIGKVVLIAGDTLETLPRMVPSLPKMDIIYIDGCHAYPWVRSDWENVRKLMHDKTVVVFDDYPGDGVRRVIDEMNGFAKLPICHPLFRNRGKILKMAVSENSLGE